DLYTLRPLVGSRLRHSVAEHISNFSCDFGLALPHFVEGQEGFAVHRGNVFEGIVGTSPTAKKSRRAVWAPTPPVHGTGDVENGGLSRTARSERIKAATRPLKRSQQWPRERERN